MDLPADFEQVGEVELIYGLTKDFREVKIEALRMPETAREFESTIKTRKAELTRKPHSQSPSKTMLALEKRTDERTVLLRTYSSSLRVDAFTSEVYRHMPDVVMRTTVQIYSDDQPDVIEAAALSVAGRTKFIPEPTSAGRGTCLGPLLIDAGQDGERFAVSFISKRLPDVVIEFSSNSLLAKSDSGLLARRASKQTLLDAVGLRSETLRKGRITITGRPGEEILEKGKEHGKVVRQLTAEAVLLKPATFSEPSFAISMTMGGQLASGEYVDASMSEGDAIAMWDAMVKSIRVRSGAI